MQRWNQPAGSRSGPGGRAKRTHFKTQTHNTQQSVVGWGENGPEGTWRAGRRRRGSRAGGAAQMRCGAGSHRRQLTEQPLDQPDNSLPATVPKPSLGWDRRSGKQTNDDDKKKKKELFVRETKPVSSVRPVRLSLVSCPDEM